MVKKKLLITGINGFLGSNLAKELTKNFAVIGLEHPSSNLERIKDLDLQVYTTKQSLDIIFKEHPLYAIIHAATFYRRDNSETFEDLFETNVVLPFKLLTLAEEFNCEIFVNTDTFFNNPKYNYTYLPDYTLSKKHAIEWLQLIRRECVLINMKIFHMYGPNDAPNKFIPYVISSLKNNVQTLNLTPGEQLRDFVYIDDVTSAYSTILNQEKPLNFDFKEFQVGSGISHSVKDMVRTAKELVGSTTELKFGVLPYREGEIMEAQADIAELTKYGWRPQYSLEQGFKEVIKS